MRNLIKKTEKRGQPHRTYDWQCKANGCPLPASRITEWHDNLHGARGDKMDGAPKGGCCHYHASNKAHNWNTITGRIKKMEPLFRVIAELDQLSTAQQAEVQPETVITGSEPKEGETLFQWTFRMRAKIDDYISRNLPAEASRSTRKKVNMQELIRGAIQT